ncbi:hypothetical protein [Thermococcus sp. MAR1]|uniref:hypothetical protein n=1 Tax=Thermococcus sp. MAR1 TaxID=1638263 RepID=UPI00143C80E2|nr:hypothetical protein [Thermococcus sp. MAR1]NJE10660.1 hypothetical protein [Thermococcus sp. MAR1]
MAKRRRFLYSMFFSFFFLSGAILDIRETNPQNWVTDSLILVMITIAVILEYWYLSGLISKNKNKSYGVTIIVTATTALLLIKILLGEYSQLVRYITFGAIITIFYGLSSLVIFKHENASKH